MGVDASAGFFKLGHYRTPAFFDGPQGVRRLEPLAQRLQVDFQTDARFDNLRAVQVR